ncbi:hypothetical protein [Anabaena sp. CCY 0017]|uniref:hypothetical protein n=1 Tax=Anabaena sp. CCY 0017 TaxID=3103866 RepID=UPI0039C748BD
MPKINFKNGSKLVTVASSLMAVASLWSVFRAEENVKPLAVNILIASISIAATNQLTSKTYEDSANSQLDEILKFTEGKFNQLETERKATNKTLEELQRLYDVRKQEVTDYQQQVVTLGNTVNSYQTQCDLLTAQLQHKADTLKKVLEEDTDQYFEKCSDLKIIFHDEINQRIAEVCNRVDNSIKRNLASDDHISIHHQLKQFESKLEECFNDCQDLLQDIQDLAADDIENTLKIYCDINQQLTLIQVKYRGLLNINERLLLHQASKFIKECKSQSVPITKAQSLIREQSDYQRQQLETVYSRANDNDAGLNELRKQIQDLLNQVEQKNLELANARKPIKWGLATREDLRCGNIIISYFEAMGLILDRAKADYETWQGTLSFHIDRNNRVIIPSELNSHSEKLQQLTHTLSPVSFKWNAEEGLMTAYLHLTRKPVKQSTSESDINKLWKTADKFPSLVKHWSRVRITGGSESGKSPTAENLAVCILANRSGVARVFNPQFGSHKDRWTIPTAGQTHQDSVSAILTMAENVNNKVRYDEFSISIFDEIDSSMVQADEPKAVGQAINTIIKQASHSDFGVLFLGQNANVKNYPGMDRSDWNSAINLHLGANCYDAIANSNQFTTEEQARLKVTADRLTEYCQVKNDELGLDKSNPQAYRFGLVLGDGRPYFIQLPDFGLYTYDQLTPVACPKCGSNETIKNGNSKRKCKDCNHVFKA